MGLGGIRDQRLFSLGEQHVGGDAFAVDGIARGGVITRRGQFDRPPMLAADGSERPAGPNEEPRIDESIEPGQLLVFADADFCNDLYLMQRFGLAQNTQTQQALQGAQRMVFGLMNLVNNLTSGKELVQIRKPALTDRSLDQDRIDEDKESIRLKAVWMMPMIVVGFGLLWWVLRTGMTRVPSPAIDAARPVAAPVGAMSSPGGPPSTGGAEPSGSPSEDVNSTPEDTQPEEPQS